MPNTTDANVAGEKTTTEPVTPEVTTQPSDTGIQKRIDGLTAEKGRLADQLEAMRTDMEAVKEKHKSDEEKRVDELVQAKVDAEYGGQLQRLENLEKELAVKRDKLLEGVPEEHRAMVDTSAAVETQIAQAEGVLRLLKMETALDPITGSASPAPEPAAQRYTWQQWQEYTQLAYNDTKAYREREPEMTRAYLEGRVDIPPKRGTFDRGSVQTG